MEFSRSRLPLCPVYEPITWKMIFKSIRQFFSVLLIQDLSCDFKSFQINLLMSGRFLAESCWFTIPGLGCYLLTTQLRDPALWTDYAINSGCKESARGLLLSPMILLRKVLGPKPMIEKKTTRGSAKRLKQAFGSRDFPPPCNWT